MLYFKVIDKDTGPTRLFIGGVHGKEGITTHRALKNISEHQVKDGRLILFNGPSHEYISTINREYYSSKTGKKILSLIKEYQPDIYLELHCYRTESFYKLTDTDRIYKMGIPPLVELENGILIGSVSPLIRIAFFRKYDFAFVLEIPCKPSSSSLNTYSDILNMAAGSSCRFEILEKLESSYPYAIKKARKYFLEFSNSFAVIFNSIWEWEKENPQEPQTLKESILEVASQMDIFVTENQVELIVQAVLLAREYPTSNIIKTWQEA